MSTIDIRNDNGETTKIRVADRDGGRYITEFVVKNEDGNHGITIKDSSGSPRALDVKDREMTENLIKALQKAIELRWV